MFVKVHDYIICMFNHKHDEELTEKSEAFTARRASETGNIYSDFDIKVNCCSHPVFIAFFAHVILEIRISKKRLHESLRNVQILKFVE